MVHRKEIEISPAMLSAGEKVIEDWAQIDTPASLAKKVYVAMAAAEAEAEDRADSEPTAP
jgi:hypothetical protein